MRGSPEVAILKEGAPVKGIPVEGIPVKGSLEMGRLEMGSHSGEDEGFNG